ncbi:MAG: deoxyribose-phosphate aldolase [Proteobacteria bacterium]|nr:deoxyribose-phosphate aldolase [Pseudomonadota bacterium]NIS72552.1 deoxyribose-phosphate aldolase [Pseudomonadota bacterium]
MYLSLPDFRKRVEFSLCQPYASNDDVMSFCDRALSVGVGVVCVNPVNIPLTVKLLEGTGIEVSGNVGFPFGSHSSEVKVLETSRAVEAGATQIDMVINVGALRSKKDDVVLEDIQGVVEAAQGRIVKTIIETWVLTDEEKERACRIAEKAGACLVKTSTGVRTQYLIEINANPRGATVEDVGLMRRVLTPRMKIKASGGIYTLELALELIRRGADQLGLSQGERIIREFKKTYGDGVELFVERQGAESL